MTTLVPYGMLNSPDQRFADIATAPTVVLDAALGNYGQLTGSAAISAVTLAEGKSVWVRFSAAGATIANTSTLKTPTGAGMTMGAGDWVQFLALGSVVYVAGVHRYVADRATVTALTISAGVVNIDLSLGEYFTLARTAAVTSFTFSNPPGAGKGGSIMIFASNTASNFATALTQFTGVPGALGTSATAVDVIALTSVDNWASAHCGTSVDVA